MSRLLEALKQYLKPSGTDPASEMRDVVRYAALGITGAYAVSTAYRCGAFRHILPASLYTKLVDKVEFVKSKTQPMVDPARYELLTSHLIKTYSLVSLGYMGAALGTALFFRFPHIPIGITMAATAAPAGLLMFARPWMTPAGKLACYGIMCFASGVSLGPMNWIAFDSLAPFALIVSSTAAGFILPLFLTRGAVSYVASSQLLSCSLSIVSAGLVVADARARGASARRVEEDVNVLLTAQALANAALSLAHTLPAMYRFLSASTPIADLKAEDPVFQAGTIFGATAYIAWSFFRIMCRHILRKLHREKNLSKEERSAAKSLNEALQVTNLSNIGASIIFLMVYVRSVTILQNLGAKSNDSGATGRGLEVARKIFARFSPLSI